MTGPREQHEGGLRGQFRLALWVSGPIALFATVLLVQGFNFLGLLILGALLVMWGVFAIHAAIYSTAVSAAGSIAGKVFMPSGSSTPPPKPLSHIEAMVARGDVGKAAEAYKAEILSDPADVTSCERLGTLALRELKDFPLAVWAYREAERRAETPARGFGYGLIVAGIYRDQFRDLGKTVVELRRLVHTYPDAPRLDSLRGEIDELKTGMFDGPAG